MTDDVTAFLQGTGSSRKFTRDARGWYNDLPPIPGYGRGPWRNVSSIAGVLADEEFLTLWKQRQVVYQLAVDLDLYQRVVKRVTGSRFSKLTANGRKVLNTLVEEIHEAAGSNTGAGLGTAFHEHSEAFDGGANPGILDLTDDQVKMLRAYHHLRVAEEAQTTEYIERTVFIPDLPAVGTLDRIDLIRGVMTVTDVKSQKSMHFSHVDIPAQLASYAHATLVLDWTTRTWEPMPEVDQKWGLVYWVPADDPGVARPCDIDLTKGWKYAKASAKVLNDWREDRSTIVVR